MTNVNAADSAAEAADYGRASPTEDRGSSGLEPAGLHFEPARGESGRVRRESPPATLATRGTNRRWEATVPLLIDKHR